MLYLCVISFVWQVREAQLQQWNYILVVGEQEAKEGTVNVRTRDNHVHGMHTISSFLEKLSEEKVTRSLTTCFKAPEVEGGEPKTAAPADESWLIRVHCHSTGGMVLGSVRSWSIGTSTRESFLSTE